MKNRLIYSLILCATLIVACSEDFTESTAFASLSDAALQNAQGVDLQLIGAYSALDGNTNTPGADWEKSGDNWWFDVMADDAHKGSTDGDQADLFLLETYDWTSANPYLTNKFRALYAGVGRANSVIDLISKVEGGDFTQQLAEARFLRGHFHFELQKIWGNVAYISEENFANTEFSQPNTGPIWDQIEADFAFAAANLPNSQSDSGRPNAFKSSGENGSESVFAIQYTADGGQSFNGNLGGTLNFSGPNGWCCGFYQPTQDLVNAFQVDGSGLPLLDTFNQTDVANDYGINSSDAFTPETGTLDPRLDYTVGRRGIQYNGYGAHPGKDWIRASFADISGPYLAKKSVYQNGDDANVGTGAWGQQRSGINYHIIRYADVLLMAAEAAAETNDLATALNYVNQVRNRAKNMTPVQNLAGTGPAANYSVEPYPAFADQAFARKAVRMERRLELGMEGHRLFDVRRWDGTGIMNAFFMNEGRTITSFAGKSKGYTSTNDLCPIPLRAIDLSQGVLTQNPGY